MPDEAADDWAPDQVRLMEQCFLTSHSRTRRRVTIAIVFAAGTSVSTSVDAWPVPERPGISLTEFEQNTQILNKPSRKWPKTRKLEPILKMVPRRLLLTKTSAALLQKGLRNLKVGPRHMKHFNICNTRVHYFPWNFVQYKIKQSWGRYSALDARAWNT